MMVEKEAASSSLKGKVRSAVALTAAEKAALLEKLQDRFTTSVDLTFEVEPALLGGVAVRVGDQVIDGSVKGRLEALAQNLRSGR
jgi:F-type H+-transporting ATPase subunit delta